VFTTLFLPGGHIRPGFLDIPGLMDRAAGRAFGVSAVAPVLNELLAARHMTVVV